MTNLETYQADFSWFLIGTKSFSTVLILLLYKSSQDTFKKILILDDLSVCVYT